MLDASSALVGLLALLALALPFVYARYFSSNSAALHYSNPHPAAKERIAAGFTDVGLRKKLVLEHLSRVCHNALHQRLPYSVRELHGGGPFFDPHIRSGDLASLVVVVPVVDRELVPRHLVPKASRDDPEPAGDDLVPVPRRTAAAVFFEDHVMPLATAQAITDKFPDPVAALPELLRLAAEATGQPVQEVNKWMPTYVQWLEGATWALLFDHQDWTEEGLRNPKPWEAERVMKRVMRFGTKGVDIGPVLVDHPEQSRSILFNESVQFHLLWSDDRQNVLDNARRAFDTYKAAPEDKKEGESKKKKKSQ